MFISSEQFLIRTPVIIIASFVVVLILMLISLPPWLDYLRPQLVVLTLLYWLLYLPQRVGIVAAWVLGIVLDVLYNVALGEHALILTVIAYIALRWQMRVHLLVFWQRLLLIFVLVSLYILPQFYMEFTAKSSLDIWIYWLSPLVSALIWPYIVQFFSALSDRFHLA